MLKNILYFLYLNNLFRICMFLSKIISLFNKKYQNRVSFFNYFKKKRKKIKRSTLKILYKPKIFIFRFKYHKKAELIKKIYEYENFNTKNKFSNEGHKNVYQSDHKLNKDKNFKKISIQIERFINNNISNYINSRKLFIVSMWFVITKKIGFIKKHSHLNSDFSAIYYLKTDRNYSKLDGLKIYNNYKTIKIYEYNYSKKKFVIYDFKKKFLLFKPKSNDLIFFNSYIEHSVTNHYSKIFKRISLPFDLSLY
jgi:uncharacterized protein (TIGR02466 family)